MYQLFFHGNVASMSASEKWFPESQMKKGVDEQFKKK